MSKNYVTLMSVEKIPEGEVYRIVIQEGSLPKELRRYIERKPHDTVEILTDDNRIANLISEAVHKSIGLFTSAIAENN